MSFDAGFVIIFVAAVNKSELTMFEASKLLKVATSLGQINSAYFLELAAEYQSILHQVVF